MFRQIVHTSVGLALLAGCATGELGGEGTSGGVFGNGEETESGETTDDAGAETGSEDGAGDEGVEVGPIARIVWTGEVDGDLLVHARLGAAVAERFPEGMWALRLDEDEGVLYAQIVDGQGVALELVRVMQSDPHMYPAQGEVLSYCFPFPNLPPVEAGCSASPCPWQEPWPWQGQSWPACFELSAEGSLVRVVGAVEGTAVGEELAQGVAPVTIYEGVLGASERGRLDTVARMAEDLASLSPELAAMELACLDCMLAGSAAAGHGLDCINEDSGACTQAFWGTQWHQDNCDSVCSS